jgi:hypothetical protein
VRNGSAACSGGGGSPDADGQRRPRRPDRLRTRGVEEFYDQTRTPAAIKVGDTLRLTGHTGEAADNVSPPIRRCRSGRPSATLRSPCAKPTPPGPTSSRSIRIGSHCRARPSDPPRFLEDPYPVWTDVGVTALFWPEALVKIRTQNHGTLRVSRGSPPSTKMRSCLLSPITSSAISTRDHCRASRGSFPRSDSMSTRRHHPTMECISAPGPRCPCG